VRLILDADPQELRDKSLQLVSTLAKAIRFDAPDLADLLFKALPPKEPQLRFRALRQLHEITAVAYKDQVQKMLADIHKILDSSVQLQKAEELVKQGFGEPKDPDDKLEPGDVDPASGQEVPDPADAEEDEEEGEEEEPEEKSLASEPEYDYSQPIVAQDQRAYERMKAVLKKMGYEDADFEKDGALYGWSVNELITLAKPGE
jgi:hypothetical protein